jgi:hypothetical protein
MNRNVRVSRQMLEHPGLRAVAMFLAFAALLCPSGLPADVVAVRYQEGLLHGFLELRTAEGTAIAVGDLSQVAQGDRVTSDLLFHFKDGSTHHETIVFSQRGKFRLLKYQLVQKGPTFKHPMETSLDAATGQFTARYRDDDGKEKNLTERVDVPADVANGMVPVLLENLPPNVEQTTWSLVASTPKPRTVKLAISFQGEEPFTVGGSTRKAKHYLVKVELGGVAGVVAPLVGKQPADSHVWISAGEFPVFIRSEGPLYEGGPVWTIQHIGPVGPQK